MKKSLPIWIGLFAAGIPAVWMSVITVEQIPAFIRTMLREVAVELGLLLFQSREAALAIEYPVLLVFCAVFGVSVGLLCRFILSRTNQDTAHRSVEPIAAGAINDQTKLKDCKKSHAYVP